MSPLLHTITLWLWLSVMTTQAGLLLLLIRLGAWREYPAFVSFIAFSVARSSLLACVYVGGKNWTLFSVITYGAYVPQFIALIALILEVTRIVFQPYDSFPRSAKGTLVLSCFCVAVAAVIFALSWPGAPASEWIRFANGFDQALSMTLCGIFGLFSAFSLYMGIPWEHRVYGISVGFFFYLSVDVFVSLITARLGVSASSYVWPVDMLAFLISLATWIAFFHRVPVPRSSATSEQLNKIWTLLNTYVISIEALERAHQAESSKEPELQILWAAGERNV
jgi:hypothetical protein